VPADWKTEAVTPETRLHQLAPYIGKLKPTIARELVRRYTNPGEVVLDCFAGSGTIPLEAMLQGRKVLAFDANPYAVTLTRAKLEAPPTLEGANELLARRLSAATRRPRYRLNKIPIWVQKFFHPETLQNALRFADECIDRDDQFLLACLLSILHHQRPGFLSYPSSHLVPYLRDRKFPQSEFPEMYEERELAPRLLAKVRRTYKNMIPCDQGHVVRVGLEGVADLHLNQRVDAIITSPPYMNALDYVRDNRLRMWFLDRRVANYSPEPTEKEKQSDEIIDAFAKNALGFLRKGGRCVLVVGETVRRKRMTSHPADRIYSRLLKSYPKLKLEEVIHDDIPDVRRSRRKASATKRELILVLRNG
jgi:hypothetical protein